MTDTEETIETTTEDVDIEKAIIGILEERGITKERFASLDTLDEKLSELKTVLTSTPHNPSGDEGKNRASSNGLSESDLLAKVEKLMDTKLAGAIPEAKKPPLIRWLGL